MAEVLITSGDIKRAVTANAFEAGKQYQQQGRVREPVISPDGTEIQAEVRGGKRQIYAIDILLDRSARGQVSVMGDCSCMVGRNCKHVAATLLACERQFAVQRPAQLPAAPRQAGTTVPVGPLRPTQAPAQGEFPGQEPVGSLLETESEEYPPTVRRRRCGRSDARADRGGCRGAVRGLMVRRGFGQNAWKV